MPFCGYCGRTLSYGEVCGCRSKTGETPDGDPEKAPGFHSYFCGYCGNKVEAGKICSCPKAQFEARFVRTRPRPQQYIEHRTPPERTAPPTAQPLRFHTPPPLDSSSTERTAPPTAQPQRFYTPPPLNSSSTERPTAPYRPAGTSFAQPPQDRTNGYPLPPHYVPYSPAQWQRLYFSPHFSLFCSISSPAKAPTAKRTAALFRRTLPLPKSQKLPRL